MTTNRAIECRHILMLDKSASDRFVAKQSLQRFGGKAIEFVETDCEEEAFQLIAERPPDCLIVDFYLGRMSGVDFLERLKEPSSGLLPCPVVMITGAVSCDHDVLLSLRAGAHDFIERVRILEPSFWEAVVYAKSRYEISRELFHANKELSELNDELTLKSRLKAQFIANATHELRTPLSAIVGITELAAKETDLTTLHNYLDSIRYCGESLINSVDEVLELTRIEMGEFVLQETSFELSDVFEDVQRSFSVAAREKKVELLLDMPEDSPSLLGDSRRLKLLLISFLDNALKFTSYGTVTLRARCPESQAETDEVFCTFEVEDTGSGIPETEQAKIFEPNYQVANPNNSGNGVGLTVVKAIVEQMRGEVGCRSEFGSGSTFWFRIPLKRNASNFKRLLGESSSMKVMIAEDNRILADIIRRQLQNLGCDVTVAQDGIEAVECFTDDFDLLIFDARMPRLGGPEACKRIRERFKTEVPIVLLTADSFLPQEDLTSYGLTKAFVKPLPESRLFSEVLALARQ